MEFVARKSRRKDNTKKTNARPHIDIYKFMIKAANCLCEDPDIVEMVVSCGDCNIKFVADEENSEKYLLFGCSDNGYPYTKRPFFCGSADEVIKYLHDKSNADDVLFHAYYSKIK